MLLFDENLSPKLIARVSKTFPACLHVLQSRLDNSPDIEIWRYAREYKLTIVTKDKDFLHFARQHGFPPKLVHIQTGNVRLAVIEEILLNQASAIKTFVA
ncbi:DUF5615 family PIN-like protein [Endozoicomonas euniceicola]|uniref:DUF5615 family PIN-like protein n=1 Tax=Endozoicomonas euniceicola TaxID=1234143 RepID=A0ABY6H0G1_9GAMM|nr:DUF5615 family PIN-like protein [Endozoicomonas euniceicola]UYM18531.1 DUF5615 family PIN-like protein [Endozoicomonas euniceicola]